MKKYFNRINQLLAYLFVTLMFCGGFIINHTIHSVVAEDTFSAEEQEEKILSYYHEATVEENFKNNQINVILKSEYSNLGEIRFDDFEVVECVAKITSIKHNLEEVKCGKGKALPLLEQENQIITLELATQDKQIVLEAIKLLNTLDIVLVAEPAYIYATEECWTPNDSNYGSQWGLHGTNGINAEATWDITRGSANVKVGIMESQGIDMNHEDLQGRVFEGNYVTPAESNPSHGTHVAGIIGAKQNDFGIAGISESSMYLMNCNMTDALSYATQNGIKLINASFKYVTETDEDAPYNSAHYVAIKNYNGLLICCAHNQKSNLDINPVYPASYDLPNVISVGSIDENGERSSFSNFGENTVDIYAPGGNILSAYPQGLCTGETRSTRWGERLSCECEWSNRYGTWEWVPNGSTHYANGYHYMSGTSMATPHVTGVAALMLAAEPTLTAAELKEYIIKNSDNITISTPDGSQNVKKLNAYKAVEYAYYCKQPYRDLFAGGTGAAYDPFIISNEAQFRNIEFAHRPVYITYQGYEEQINYYFKLDNNITLSGDWTPFPYKFSGVFDGCNHSITYEMEITQGDLNTRHLGLFGFVVSPGKIRNLTLSNCKITSDEDTTLTCPSGDPGIGILAGSVYEAGSFVEGNQVYGGIHNITISNPYICCNVADAKTGGIAGSIQRTSVTNCTVSGGEIISYSGMLGGMAGYGEINSFSGGSCNTTIRKNNYSDSDLVGPIVGNSQERSTVGGTTTIENDSPCVAKGTLITLADGRQVPVETLTGNEMLLVWNLQTGSFDSAPILFIDSDPWQTYKVINLAFSDGTSVKVIYEHGFWNYDLNEYVYLREDAAQYIGHWFNKQGTDGNGNMISQRVQLTGVSVQYEATAAYSPVTYGHLCYYVNGMLSMPGGAGGLFNTFDVDAATMKYDEAQMQADIAEYGLFTYEEFYGLVPVSEEAFEAFNGQYLKVAIGKGLIGVDTLNRLAVRYAEYLG